MLGGYLQAARDAAPLIHVITNFVTVNDCANIILAAGGSPTMAEDPREVDEIAAQAAALALNLGGIGKAEAMVLAGRAANRRGIPVVLDPVAAGASALRRETARRLLEEIRFAVIRGNASEIRALALGAGGGRGVDAAPADLVTKEGLAGAADLAKDLARRTGAAVVISGPLDIVTDGSRAFAVSNGCPEMARITGSGCMLTALTGALCGASPDRPLEAALAAAALLGVCGERANRRRLANGTGTATFRTDLIDGVSLIAPEELEQEARYDPL